jgi:hypothetical protein
LITAALDGETGRGAESDAVSELLDPLDGCDGLLLHAAVAARRAAKYAPHAKNFILSAREMRRAHLAKNTPRTIQDVMTRPQRRSAAARVEGVHVRYPTRQPRSRVEGIL